MFNSHPILPTYSLIQTSNLQFRHPLPRSPTFPLAPTIQPIEVKEKSQREKRETKYQEKKDITIHQSSTLQKTRLVQLIPDLLYRISPFQDESRINLLPAYRINDARYALCV